MSAQTTKQGIVCSVQEDRTAPPGRYRSLWEMLKVSDGKVTHHSHQKGAFGLDGERNNAPTGHKDSPADRRTRQRFGDLTSPSLFASCLWVSCGSGLRVSLCAPLIRADQGLLWGSSGLENKGKQGRCTDVRFLGGSRREGEGFTRIPESNRRRSDLPCTVGPGGGARSVR